MTPGEPPGGWRSVMGETVIDYEALLQANLTRVFSERDAVRREAAIRELYAPDAVLYEPVHVAQGHAEIGRAVDALLATLPADFVFTAVGAAAGHHGLGRLRWRAGPPGAPAVVTGMDVVAVEDDRIRTLHVFLDPPSDTAAASSGAPN